MRYGTAALVCFTMPFTLRPLLQNPDELWQFEAGIVPRARQYIEQLIAVHATPQLVHHHHAIAVAVEREAHLSAHARHRHLQQVRNR